MSNEKVQEEVITLIAQFLGLSPPDLDKHSLLEEDLGLAPIELNDLLAELADHFKISFNSEEVSNLKTIDDIIFLVEDNLI
ncbi:acyl carrier protein [Candidatus Daviesbacteria bacterium]|nr:acyl carrier protein [Candidatus Daviesbacteria bacterium]